MSITIQEVLAQINTNVDENRMPLPFDVSFVKSDGSIREMKAQKAGKYRGRSGSVSNSRYKENNLYMLFLEELPSRNFKEIYISTVIGFNGQKVCH